MSDFVDMKQRQRILGDFGELAVRSQDLGQILQEACRLASDALGTKRAKILEILHAEQELFVRAGVGWESGIVGTMRLPMEEHSSETFAIKAAEPVITQNIAHEDRFQVPSFMKDAGVVALVNVPIILPGGRLFGLLQVDATEPRDFDDDDIHFLRTYATILGPVIDRLIMVPALRASEERFRILVEGMPQLVWTSRDEGDWSWGSPQWLDYTGQTQEEAHGLGWLQAVHPDDREATMQAWREARVLGMLDVEFRLRRASDGGYRWHRTRSLPFHDGAKDNRPKGDSAEWLGTSTDIDDLKLLQAHQGILVAELQHRTRNLLGVVLSIASRSIAPSAGRDRYNARLGALGRVQGFLSGSADWEISLKDLLDAELIAAGEGASQRIVVEGPPLRLPGDKVQTLALALHELATNAVKYGAIGQPQGRLKVVWRIETSDAPHRLVLDWRESKVTMPVAPPERRGFGSELIKRALPYQLKATTTLDFEPDGVHCTIILPLAILEGQGQSTAPRA
jgi:PAS domain S-box-containing protein